MIEPVAAMLMLAFIAALLVFVYKANELDDELRRLYPQVRDDDESLRVLVSWRFWLSRLVFPHRRLRARLESQGIRDKALDKRIAAVVRWNRLAILLYLVVLGYAAVLHW